MTNESTLRLSRRALAASALVGACPSLAWASDAIQLGRQSPAWHLFWATGRAPNRQIYLIDARYNRLSETVYDVQAATLMETPRSDVDFWAGRLQLEATPQQVVRARRRVESVFPWMSEMRVRTLSSYIVRPDGGVSESGETPWSPFKTPIDVLTLRIASDPGAIENPAPHNMVFIGNFFRPVDAVDLVRRVLPQLQNSRKD